MLNTNPSIIAPDKSGSRPANTDINWLNLAYHIVNGGDMPKPKRYDVLAPNGTGWHKVGETSNPLADYGENSPLRFREQGNHMLYRIANRCLVADAMIRTRRTFETKSLRELEAASEKCPGCGKPYDALCPSCVAEEEAGPEGREQRHREDARANRHEERFA